MVGCTANQNINRMYMMIWEMEGMRNMSVMPVYQIPQELPRAVRLQQSGCDITGVAFQYTRDISGITAVKVRHDMHGCEQ